jgi:hypothetical protein
LKIQRKVSGLVADRKIQRKAHGQFHVSPLQFTKSTKATTDSGKGGKAEQHATKRVFPAANQSKIDDIVVVKRQRQRHPGNSAHLNLDDMQYCTSCNTHVAKGSFDQHCKSSKHDKAQKSGVVFQYCVHCATGHPCGVMCPKPSANAELPL